MHHTPDPGADSDGDLGKMELVYFSTEFLRDPQPAQLQQGQKSLDLSPIDRQDLVGS